MNPIDISFTESVQGAGGAGFAAPIFRAGMPPSDFASSTPQGRAGMGADFLAGIDMQGLDPLSSMRDAFDEEVGKTYEWIAAVLEKGYDPRKMDMSKPESKQVYIDFMKQKRTLQLMADDLKLSGRLKQDGRSLAPATATAQQALEMGDMPDFMQMVRESNKTFSSSGFSDQEAFGQAVQAYNEIGQGMFDAYMQFRDLAKDSPAKQKLLDAQFDMAVKSRQRPLFKGMTELQERRLAVDEARLNLQIQKLKMDGEKDAYKLDVEGKTNTVYLANGDSFTYESEVLSTPQVKFSSTEGYVLATLSAREGGGGGGKQAVKRGIANSGTIDRYEIIAVDANGVPIITDTPSATKDIKGYKVFAVGEGKYGKEDVPVWTDVSTGKNKYSSAINQVVAENISRLESTAKEMTDKLKKAGAGKSAIEQAEEQRTVGQAMPPATGQTAPVAESVTDVGNIFE